jgi:hypothetical protein
MSIQLLPGREALFICAGYALVGFESLAGMDRDINSEFNFLNSNLFGIGRAGVYCMRGI